MVFHNSSVESHFPATLQQHDLVPHPATPFGPTNPPTTRFPRFQPPFKQDPSATAIVTFPTKKVSKQIETHPATTTAPVQKK